MVEFTQDQLIIAPLFKTLFSKKKKIPYKEIERIEAGNGEDVLFYMRDGKKLMIKEPGLPIYYTAFGEMLKNYRIAFAAKDDSDKYSMESVREKAEHTRNAVLLQANREVKEKLSAEYELEGKLIERVIGMTLELRLLRNGIPVEEVNQFKSIDETALLDEMDIAFISEWDPVMERGTYTLAEEVKSSALCEENVRDVLLQNLFEVCEEMRIGTDR